mgnify:CR=1 FL=1
MSKDPPISQAWRAQMNCLANALDEFFNGSERPKKIGFALLMFEFGEQPPGRDRINYISNAIRDDMIFALKELVARMEGHLTEEEQMQ